VSSLNRHEYLVEPDNDLNENPTAQGLVGYHIAISSSKLSVTPNPQDLTNISKPRTEQGDYLLLPGLHPIHPLQALRFATKVIGKWFGGRTLLISDAAYDFPSFEHYRDTRALSWRSTLLQNLAYSSSCMSSSTALPLSGDPTGAAIIHERVLTGWVNERQVCDHATKMATTNCSARNQRSAWQTSCIGV
jgi:hypothetical protein